MDVFMYQFYLIHKIISFSLFGIMVNANKTHTVGDLNFPEQYSQTDLLHTFL